MNDFLLLEDALNINFKNKDLLKQAFIHRSYLNENPDTHLPHNERLEFLGDAVLELVVTDYLYQNFPNTEGDLTNWRAALVNSRNLALIAERLNFNEFLLLSKGEKKDIGKARQFILANTIEAFMGALYLDLGLRAVSTFIEDHIISELPAILKEKRYIDPKSRFQELAQEHVSITPSYNVMEESGPDHDKDFVVGVFLNKENIATGHGSSKQEAEEAAAAKALDIKNW